MAVPETTTTMVGTDSERAKKNTARYTAWECTVRNSMSVETRDAMIRGLPIEYR